MTNALLIFRQQIKIHFLIQVLQSNYKADLTLGSKILTLEGQVFFVVFFFHSVNPDKLTTFK